jgi:hypothetical protein
MVRNASFRIIHCMHHISASLRSEVLRLIGTNIGVGLLHGGYWSALFTTK